jgi:hypothetical protein
MKTKLRASNISIESPNENAEVWVRVTIQQVIYDDNNKIVNIIPRYDFITKPLREFIADNYGYITTDGSIAEIPGIDVMNIITGVVMDWIVAKYKGSVDKDGNLWL